MNEFDTVSLYKRVKLYVLYEDLDEITHGRIVE
jgi:hypothetical protein